MLKKGALGTTGLNYKLLKKICVASLNDKSIFFLLQELAAAYVNSVFPGTARPWNSLPAELFF